MDKQDLPKNSCVEVAQELLNHVNALEKLTQEILEEKNQKEKEEQENKNRIQAERIKQETIENNKSKEKTQIGTEVLSRLFELKKHKAFTESVKLLIYYDIKGELKLYCRTSSLPAEALSNEGRIVIHKFVLVRDGNLLFECSEVPRCFAESIMVANQFNSKRRQQLNSPEDFNAIPYRSLKEFNEILNSDILLRTFKLQINELYEDLKKKRILSNKYSKSSIYSNP